MRQQLLFAVLKNGKLKPLADITVSLERQQQIIHDFKTKGLDGARHLECWDSHGNRRKIHPPDQTRDAILRANPEPAAPDLDWIRQRREEQRLAQEEADRLERFKFNGG